MLMSGRKSVPVLPQEFRGWNEKKGDFYDW